MIDWSQSKRVIIGWILPMSISFCCYNKPPQNLVAENSNTFFFLAHSSVDWLGVCSELDQLISGLVIPSIIYSYLIGQLVAR